MDADWLDSHRDQFLSQREKRWSMNSQRLEEIVAELMRPISSDGRRSFDTDLSSLLEEYLTEAGLHALDAAEDEGGAGTLDTAAAPNFAEIALLLQQSANIYGRKVDFLYKHVLSVSDSLTQSTQELANASTVSEEATATATTPRRAAAAAGRRRAGPLDFGPIELVTDPSATRDPDAVLRPPPTLPRMYVELEPRLPAPHDLPVLDYAGDNIGLLSDFQVTWRLHEGRLVDELESGSGAGGEELRPISLLELQAAMSAAAPASPPPWAAPPSPASSAHEDSPARELQPLGASTPLPAAPAPLGPLGPLDRTTDAAATVKRVRKRRSNVNIDDIFNGSVKIDFGNELMQKLKAVREFSIDKRWIKSVVQKRKSHILSVRRRLADELDEPDELDDTQPPDRGFTGWSRGEAARQLAALPAPRTSLEPDSDDDDGFFEQSSGGSVQSGELEREGRADDGDAWCAAVLRRAAAAEARGSFDVDALGARLLDALVLAPPAPRAFTDLLRGQAAQRADVSRVMLATLFLANAGNVEIVQGAPLTVDTFSVRLLSRDMRRCRLDIAANDDHDELPRR